MKIILLAAGLGRVMRGYERFAFELAAELRREGLDAECWGTSQAPGVEALPVPGRHDLLNSALDRLHADARFADLPATVLQDWSVYAEDQLFAVPAARRIQELLAHGERLLVYAKWQGGFVDPSSAPTELLKLLASASREGKAALLVHTDYIQPPIDSLLWSAGARFHALGPWITEPLVQLGVMPTEILELPMCITASVYKNCRQHREEMRRELGIPADAFAILSVGSFDTTTPDKRHGHMLQEILSLPEASRVWWVVAGSRGAVSTAWEQEAQQRLGERFIPLMNVPFERMPKLYGMADLFALASLDETFGLVYLEAQMAGLPVVIHDSRIARHLLSEMPPERLAISLADMRRPGAAAAAMERWMKLLSDGQERAAVRSSLDGFAQAQERRFGWESVGARYAEAFAKVMQSPPRTEASRAPATASRQGFGTWDEQSHQQGVRLFEEGQHREALGALGRSLGGRETSERWNDWATVQVALKHFQEAEQGFRRALALDPRHAQAAANLGALLASLGRASEAVPLLEQGSRGVDPEQRAAFSHLLQECRAKQKSGQEPGEGELEAFLRKLAGPGDEEEYRFREELPYYLAVLHAIPEGSPGQKLLGAGPGARYLAPALARWKGYSDIRWCAAGEVISPDGLPQDPASIGRREGGKEFSLKTDRFEFEEGAWPYENDFFDVVFFGQTLETLSADPMRALAEINRVLHLGGQLLLTAPNLASAKSVHAILRGTTPYVDGRFRPGSEQLSEHPHREYTSAEIERMATAAGFGVAQSRTQDICWEPPEKVFPALAASGYPIGSRGDTLLLLARNEGPVRERFPAKLYDLSGARAESAPAAAQRDADRPMRVLVVHENLPRPDQSGADYRLLQVLRELRRQGHAVTYLAPRGFEREKYAPALAELQIDVYLDDAQVLRREGFEVVPGWTLQEVLREGQFDVAVFFFWFWMCVSLPEHYLDEVRRLSPRTRVAVLTDDCHGLRELRGAGLSRAWSDHERAKDYGEREAEIYRRADVVMAISDDDRRRLIEESGDTPVDLLPMVVEPGATGPGFEAREGLMYLADYHNPASREGIDWYLKEVAPIVRRTLPDLKLYLAGAGMPPDFAAGEANAVRVGFVADLAGEFAKHRVFIAPVRYGSGTKTKNLHALAHGVPIVTTPIGAEGMELAHEKSALLADRPEEFARAVIRAHTDASLWKTLSGNGRSHILKKYSQERMASLLRATLERVRDLQPRRYDPGHIWSVRLIEKHFPEVLTHHPPQERPSLRVLAHARAAADLLAAGNRAEARRQLRHVFSYVPNRMPREMLFNGFRSVAESMERTYRALGESEGAAEFRREARIFAPTAFPSAKAPPEPRRGARQGRGEQFDFSVVIPTYNRRDTLGECLDALNRQSLSPRRYEVIVVDDGGGDGTAEFCRRYKARYEFRCVRQENAGAGAARRLGVDQARGKYLVLFNDDTIADPALLSEHWRAHREHAHEKIAVLGDFRYPEAARARALTHFLSTEPFLFPQVTLDPGPHAKNAYFIASNLSLPREAVLAAGSFDPRFRIAEDTELGVRLRERGFHVRYVPEARAIHQHLAFDIGDLLRRADAYGRTQLLLFRKHPQLLGEGTGPFGKLDEAAIGSMRVFVAQRRDEVEGAVRGLERFDTVDFVPFFSRPSGERTAAEEVMELFKRAVPVVFWFYIFVGFLAAWDAEPNPSWVAAPQTMLGEKEAMV